MAKHLTSHPKTKTLPLVAPLVVYNGRRAYTHSTDIKTLIDAPKDLVDQYCLQPFQLIDLSQIEDDILKSTVKGGLVSLALKRVQTPKLDEIIEVLKFAEKIYSAKDKRFATIVLKYVVEGSSITQDEEFIQAIEDKFDEQFEGEIMTLAESFEARGRDKGFIEGRVEGRTDAQYEMVLRLSSKNVDVAFISEVTSFSEADVKAIILGEKTKKH